MYGFQELKLDFIELFPFHASCENASFNDGNIVGCPVLNEDHFLARNNWVLRFKRLHSNAGISCTNIK